MNKLNKVCFAPWGRLVYCPAYEDTGLHVLGETVEPVRGFRPEHSFLPEA